MCECGAEEDGMRIAIKIFVSLILFSDIADECSMTKNGWEWNVVAIAMVWFL